MDALAWSSVHAALSRGAESAGSNGADGTTLAEIKSAAGIVALRALADEAGVGPATLGYGESAPGVVSLALPNATGAARPNDLLVLLGLHPSATPEQSNDALDALERNHRIRVVARKFYGAKGMRVSFARAEDPSYSAFRFSPSALRLSPVDAAKHTVDRQLESTRRVELAHEMTRELFSHLSAEENYMMDDALHAALTASLPAYFSAGIRAGQERGFLPPPRLDSPPVGMYLWGAPGIGKSTFVTAFSRSLRFVLRQHVDPAIDVRVVKVPLNAMTVHTLTNVLSIQGISDWSVERVMEQSIVKGHLVLLHLEEAPENADAQTDLLACVHTMLAKFFRRYHEFASNVLLMVTSNYAPAVEALKGRAVPVVVKHPSPRAQLTWCRRVFLRNVPGLSDVELDACPTSTTGDVRPLNAFWLSVGYALTTTSSTATSKDIQAGKRKAIVKWNAAHPKQVLVGWDSSPAQSLVSNDGFFFFPSAAATSASGGISPKLATVLDMAVSGFLTPGVVVLRPHPEKAERNLQAAHEMEQTLIAALDARARAAGRGLSLSDRLELTREEDEIKVLGDEGEIRGGLVKFIDDATNPNVKRSRSLPDVCVVRAVVNELGSLFLREMLEAGDKSRTHRLGISKRGLVFLITLVPGSHVTAQLESRAHDVVDVSC